MAERIWDRFLTDQDKAHLAAKGEPKHWGLGNRPALLLVDLYRGVFGDKPEPLLKAMETWPGSCGLTAWDSLPYIQTLLSTAREVGIPVIHITGGVEYTPHWSARQRGSYASMSLESEEQAKRRFEIIDELAPIQGEPLIRKASPSAFWGTPLVGQLNSLEIDSVITCGESTSGCIRATVVDGCTYSYRMNVVEECVFDRHEATHAINLFDMDQKYADVLPLAEVVAYLHSWRDQREASDSPAHQEALVESATS